MKHQTAKDLLASYLKLKPLIKKRLAEFRANSKKRDEEIFSELCFCILTANANALKCDEAIRKLREKKLLLSGSRCRIKPILKGRVRFHNKKADFLVAARNVFKNGKGLNIKKRLDKKDIIATRDWLVKNIKGYGYKEASHFLRNIGLGSDIAILDRHILKNLKRYGVISSVPSSIGSHKGYLAIEEKMRKFSKKIKIPLEDLDLLFWSLQTGFIFK
ncbi:MAG: N-glycosylase/DNA lyase [Candidatus Omnitrophica bacterium]|nr:N-glycosylase/DNA lyase [Candidatus Omnitrophota bacterium]